MTPTDEGGEAPCFAHLLDDQPNCWSQHLGVGPTDPVAHRVPPADRVRAVQPVDHPGETDGPG